MLGRIVDTLHCGKAVVSEYTNNKNVKVIFIDTGYLLSTTKRSLLSSSRPRLRDPLAKSVFGVGCIGEGRHKAHNGPADTKSFSIWRAMLRRCYYKPESKPWREGCTVVEEWLDFQTFAQWYEDNYPNNGERYQLDKDTLIAGNKQYGPSTCRFVTQAENLAARQFKGGR